MGAIRRSVPVELIIVCASLVLPVGRQLSDPQAAVVGVRVVDTLHGGWVVATVDCGEWTTRTLVRKVMCIGST